MTITPRAKNNNSVESKTWGVFTNLACNRTDTSEPQGSLRRRYRTSIVQYIMKASLQRPPRISQNTSLINKNQKQAISIVLPKPKCASLSKPKIAGEPNMQQPYGNITKPSV